ncbi:FHA domain-containing protein [bacterium]|nr:MAG: FHA domain-containing protein [bacterium]RIK61608.1 MAG: hypothetical protein DCC64_12895 [Planctomycetota bacterium]
MNQLVYTHEGQRVSVPLVDRPVSLGRGDAADHRLPDKTASRVHAQFILRDARWCVEDLESANGTLVNGKKIGGVTVLSPGDVVRIGATELKFEGEPPKPPAEPEQEMPRLVFQPDPNVAPVVVLIKGRITIGRKPENSLQIDNKGVSGTHVEVVRAGRTCTLRDLESSNGTSVAGREVSQCVLNNGDVIVLGKVARLFFIDPLAQPAAAPAPVAGAGAPAAPPAGPPSSTAAAQAVGGPVQPAAGGASDRGSFEPVAEPQESLAGAWGVNLVIGLLVAGALVAGGVGLAGLLSSNPGEARGHTVQPAQADAALSFEGSIDDQGNPAGWTARFEAPGKGRALLALDPDNPGDGATSLRIEQSQTGEGAGMLILAASKPQDWELTGTVQLSFMARGQDVSLACLACALESEGRQQTLVATPLKGLSSQTWTEVKATGTVLESPKGARFVLLVAGSFAKLWLDRISVSRISEGTAAPLEAVSSGALKLTHDRSRTGECVVSNGSGHSLRIVPRVLAPNDRQLSEAGFWTIGARDKRDLALLAALPSRGMVSTVDFRAEPCAVQYLQEPGIRVTYVLRNDVQGATLAANLEFALSEQAVVTVADLRGTPLMLSLGDFHGFPYSTVTEISIERQGLCVAFPRGAVLWLDQSRKNVLVATVRSSHETKRLEVSLDVYPHSLAHARLYARLLREAEEFDSRSWFSAALARYTYLLENAPDTMAGLDAVKDRVTRIKTRRDELHAEAQTAYAVAKDTRTLLAIDQAQRAVGKFLAEFPGDAEASGFEKFSRELSEWRAAIRVTRPPEEAAKANLYAESFLRAAREHEKNGHVLLALAFLENITRDYQDTSSFKEATEMYTRLTRDLQDPAKRDAAIDRELAEIDKACDAGDWSGAMERCQALFKRFPDTPRNRDIMKRIRRIEERFD